MLRKLDIGNEDVVAFRWEGKFDEKAFNQAMVQFLQEFQSRHKMNIYLEVVDLDGFDAQAVWKDLKFSFNNMSDLRKKIDKIALVTNKDWISNLAEMSYKFIPDIKLKAFDFTETETAKLYLQE